MIDDRLAGACGDSQTGLGVGGMATKLEAATTARRAGTEVLIANGGETDVLLRIAAGDPWGRVSGHRIRPLRTARWILAGAVGSGSIIVDQGAAQALRTQGRSCFRLVLWEWRESSIEAVPILYRRRAGALLRDRPGVHGTRATSCDASRAATRTDRGGPGAYVWPVAVHRNDMIVL